ncbi:MAG: DUF692 domain-containing protein [Porticoccaceae bacterium]
MKRIPRAGFPVAGAGLGLRRALLGSLEGLEPGRLDFIELSPENWIGLGGRWGRQLRACTERYPLVCHGLSLSIGSPEPLDWGLIGAVRDFLRQHGARCYSEHLSYCSDHGHLYDLLPIPFTEQALRYTADRIRQVQDFLGERIALENVSYYAAPHQEMSESEFLCGLLAEADCQLLLDVNNIYVNAINHGYDPLAFLDAIPGERVAYVHIAGHYEEAEDLRVDSHGSEVIDPVWRLLARAYQRFGVMPTLLERDFNIPSLAGLMAEVDHIRMLQAAAAGSEG